MRRPLEASAPPCPLPGGGWTVGRSSRHAPSAHGSLLAPVEPTFQLSTETSGHATVITLAGELDIASSETLERELEEHSHAPLVVVDLRGLTFIDSTGLGLLVRAHQRAAERGARLALVRGEGQVERLLELTGLGEELLLADSPEALLEAE